MMGRVFLILLFLLELGNPALAHRLDQYLQATTIALGRDGIALQLRLTPGVSVAPRLLSTLGITRSGLQSRAETRGYVEQVQRDLSLEIDGQAETLHQVSSTFSQPSDLAAGIGEINLRFEADMPHNTASHQMIFTNRHQPAIAVYLVNTLVPRDLNTRFSANRLVSTNHAIRWTFQ